jgi:CRISPR-associated protein Csm4
VPRQGDPTDVTYRTRVKRGKLAEALAIPSPWKKPLLMLAPGAVARLDDGDGVCEWYGELVEDVHWTEEGIVQYGYAFPLPVRVSLG